MKYNCDMCNREFEDKYNKRKYCSLSCSNIARYKKWKLEYLENPKRCSGCSGPISYEGRFNNTYCSRKCSGVFRTKRSGKSKKPCLFCGTLVKNIESSYCSQKCFGEKDYRDYIERWKEGKESGVTGQSTSVRIRRYLLETRGNKCEKCDWCEINPVTKKVPIQLEHIAGNWQNNKDSN